MRGSITIFISLCLTVCMLLIGTLLESARIVLIRSQISRASEAALDSLFAGYDGDLFDEFGILMLNTAELGEFDSIEEAVMYSLNEQLSLYEDRLLIGGNFLRSECVDIDVTASYSAVAKNGELFARSVLDYMKYRIPVSLTANILEMIGILEDGEETRLNTRQKEEQESTALESGSKSGTLDEEEYEEYEELAEESIVGKIEALRENGYLELLIPSQQVVSSKSTTKSGFPSNYFSGGAQAQGQLLADIANNILYCEYVLEHFSGFTDETQNQVMEYELEYILYGYGSDRKNLEACIKQLLLVREGLNMITIYRNEALETQADALAAAIAGWTGIAPLVEAVKAAVVAAWAYAESLVDVRTLLAGYTVPLLKGEGEWVLALDEVPELIKGDYLGVGQYEDGQDYHGYLRLFLLLLDEQPKYYRTMDMIQCRLAACKPRFYMNECIYVLEIKAEIEAKPLFFNLFGQNNWKNETYQIKAGASRMY